MTARLKIGLVSGYAPCWRSSMALPAEGVNNRQGQTARIPTL